MIAATVDNSFAIKWGGIGITTGATSNTDGASNTTTIVNCLTNGRGASGCNGSSILITSYAAGLCSNYEVDSQGNTPCEAGNTCYNDWFLPAGNNTNNDGQLNCLYNNKSTIGGFDTYDYWSSTEVGALGAWAQDFAAGNQFSDPKNLDFVAVRCVRAF